MNDLNRKVYTVVEVAEMLGISRSYAYELIRQGIIPSLQLGRRWVVPKQKFDIWLERSTEESQ